MSVAISRLDRDDQRIATLADRETGRPDGQTSREELEAFFAKYGILGTGNRERLFRIVAALEINTNLGDERRIELQDLALEIARVGARDWREQVAARVPVPAERIYVERLCYVYLRNFENQSGYYGDAAFDELATDGVIDDQDRQRFPAFLSRRDENPPAGADRLGLAALEEVAQRRARFYRTVYGEAVRAGAIPGVAADGPLAPPSQEVRVSLRDGSLLRRMREQQSTGARDLVKRNPAAFYRLSWFVQQLNVPGLAKDLVDKWALTPDSPVSSPRLVQALFPADRSSSPIEEPELRSAIAAAVMGRLSDEQVAGLDAATTASLLAGLSGGRDPGVSDDGLSRQERSSGYTLRRPTGQPRAFYTEPGKGPVHADQIARLRRLTESTLTWENGRYAGSYVVRER